MSLKSRSAQVLTAALMRDESLSSEPDQVETIVKNILMDLEEAGLSITTGRESWLPPHRPCLVYVDSNADLVYTLDDSLWNGNDLPGREREFCQRLLEQALARFRPLAAPATEQVAEHLQFLLRACYGVDVQLAGASRSAEWGASEREMAKLRKHLAATIDTLRTAEG
jgi:hypothetical protein